MKKRLSTLGITAISVAYGYLLETGLWPGVELKTLATLATTIAFVILIIVISVWAGHWDD